VSEIRAEAQVQPSSASEVCGEPFARLREAGRSPLLRIPALLVLLTAAVFREALRVSAYTGDSLWRHLRVGAWILENHSIPRGALFTQFPQLPWIDLNAPYEALFYSAYALLGLRAAPLMLMFFKLALAAVTFLLAGGRRRFWTALLLSAAVQYALLDLALHPVIFSICFFALALHCLLECRSRREWKPIVWLPLLYWIWANVDAQFLFGWMLLAIFLAAEGLERFFGVDEDGARPRLPFLKLAGVALGCVATVLLTPGSVRTVSAAFDSTYNAALFKNFAIMTAMSFREPSHFVILLALLFACLQLGRRRSRDLFKIMLLMLWAIPSFRIQNDRWTILLCAVAVIGSVVCRNEERRYEDAAPGRLYLPVLAGALALLIVAFYILPANAELESRLARVAPTKACDYIRSHNLPGPIFNEYLWGGYVMWRLPEYSVSIDDRLNIYPEEVRERYFDVVMGKQRLESLPTFVSARTILLPAELALTKALTTIPGLKEEFHEVYRDDIAVVLVRR